MILTPRQKLVVRAALAYALSNADDLNDALAVEPNGSGAATIRVGDTLGPALAESAMQALIDLFEPSNKPSAEEQRAFTGTFLVSIDPVEAEEGRRDISLDDLIDFLKDAVVLEVNTEDTGNPFGVGGVELVLHTLEELPNNDV